MNLRVENEYEKIYDEHLENYLNLIKESPLYSWAYNYLTGPQKCRYLATLKEIHSIVAGKRILDLAASPFYLDYLLSKVMKAGKVDCTDINPDRLHIKKIENKNFKIIKNDLETNDLRLNKKYDIILFLEIFEHLRTDLITVFDNIKNVMHNESILILAFPNLYFYKNIIRYFLGKGVLDYYYQYEKLVLS
jgi:2-polyprenyl-3-methyl-5-hydroxy-6-metoxy-1,4-benzoquinol methylase